MHGRENAVWRRVAVLSILGGLAALAAPVAEAQHWGRPDRPRSGACFYRDANYKGDYFCANAGREYSSLSSEMNDQISSIRTFGDVEVEIYQGSRFHGRSKRFRDDVRNLRDEGWNDKLSSLQVRYRGSSGRNDEDGHHNGSHYSSSEADRIVRRAYQDVLDRQPDTAGLRLYRSRLIDDGWSERQVRDALRNSPEYRQKNRMTQQKAEDIVARAYRSVLKREPDAGSRTYVNKVLRDHWTQQDVERELRKSPEYRNRR